MIRELQFQVLCRRHADEVYRYARSFLRSEMDAEDATQEVLLRIWKHLPRINFLTARPWILRTTRNYCLDQIRRRSHASAPTAVEEEFLEEFRDELAADPAAAADASFRLEQAREALARLPEALRSVFVLYEVNGLRYREIAAALGIPINTVKVNLLRARARLSKWKEETCTSPCKK